MMQELRSQLRRYAERFDERSLRERALIFVAILVLLYVLAANLLFGPLHAEQQRLTQAVAGKRAQISALEARIQDLAGGASGVPSTQARVAALQAQLDQLQQSLAGLTRGLVSPAQMTALVEQALARNPGLQVVSVESLTPTPLFNDNGGGAKGAPAAAPADVVVYKHGLMIQVRGRYPALVQYLQVLEGLPWKVFWGRVSLESQGYPMSRLTLVLYTLSLQEASVGT